eukprot:6212938-Pleurochrysis_carterae.AAC.14
MMQRPKIIFHCHLPNQNAQDLAGIQGTFTKLTTGVSGRDLDFLFENVYAGNGDTTTFYVWEVRKQALAKYEGVAGVRCNACSSDKTSMQLVH